MNYPTLEDIKAADHLQIAKWYRKLPIASNPEEVFKIKEIHNLLFKKFGGMTPEISKSIGWDNG